MLTWLRWRIEALCERFSDAFDIEDEEWTADLHDREPILVEEPGDCPPRQSAYEWQPVKVRIVPNDQSGYVCDGETWNTGGC
jgi:hypothetical protein